MRPRTIFRLSVSDVSRLKIQCLNAGLFIYRWPNRILPRIQVDPHDVSRLGSNLRIRADAPTALPCPGKISSFGSTRLMEWTDAFKCLVRSGPSHAGCPFGGVPSGVASIRLRELLSILRRFARTLAVFESRISPPPQIAGASQLPSSAVVGRAMRLSGIVQIGFPSRDPSTICARSANRALMVRRRAPFSTTRRPCCEHSGLGAVLCKGT